MSGEGIVHLNVVNFPASVAVAKDRSLAEKAFVIAGKSSSRTIVWDVSRRAREEGLFVGMPLQSAERRVRDLLILPPDPNAWTTANGEMERIAARYAPIVQNDSGGHLYLDLTGTSRLFGPTVDTSVRIRNEIRERIGIDPTTAVATNKLVAKVATRSVRPVGLAYIRAGDEADFLGPQESTLLPGVGPAISKILSVTGLNEIGALAELSNEEARSLFGPRGIALRDAALGIDTSRVESVNLAERAVRRKLEFASDILDWSVIRSALVSLIDDASLDMRRSLLATRRVFIGINYADGIRSGASERSRSPLILDSEILAAAERAYNRAVTRRIRIRSMSLVLSELVPAIREPDLFIPDGTTKLDRLQCAVDTLRTRFGVASITRAIALAKGDTGTPPMIASNA